MSSASTWSRADTTSSSTPSTTPSNLPPHPCIQGGQPGWTSILVTQDPTENVTFPEGVGLNLAANQQFVMETHYINTTGMPAEAESSFALEYATLGSVKEHAAPFLIGTLNIAIPTASAWSTNVTCNAPGDLKLLRLFGHEHRRGTGFRVEHIDENAKSETIYETKLWDSPPIKEFPGGFPLSAKDQLRVSCDWQNESNHELSFPEEMCFAIGMFWPAPDGALSCNAGGQHPECGCGFSGGFNPGPGGSKNRRSCIARQRDPRRQRQSERGQADLLLALPRRRLDAHGPKAGRQPVLSSRRGESCARESVGRGRPHLPRRHSRGLSRVLHHGHDRRRAAAGRGDPMSAAPPLIKAVSGATATAPVTLNLGFPAN